LTTIANTMEQIHVSSLSADRQASGINLVKAFMSNQKIVFCLKICTDEIQVPPANRQTNLNLNEESVIF
jgi:hypothetical protein